MKVYVAQYNTATEINLLPLAAGLLVAHARRDPEVGPAVDLRLEVDRRDPDATARSFESPAVLGLSLYMWNLQHSLRVARHVKTLHPDCLVVVGGPSVPRSPAGFVEFLQRHPYVDVLVRGEGEVAFTEVVRRALRGETLRGIPGVVWRDATSDDALTANEPRPGLLQLGDLPSPFLDGTFDELLARHRNLITGALWETNRGCPFSCTFCDWGQATQSRVREFPRDRLREELAWISRHEFEFCWATDANFGIRRRDLEIAADVAHAARTTGFPRFFQVSWVKNSSRQVLGVYDVLRTAGVRAPLSLSMQSFDERTLVAVKRANIRLETFAELQQHFGVHGVETYCELILGLPDESYESFCRGLLRALSPFPTDFFAIYLCRLLENTELSTAESRERFGLETRICPIGIPRRGADSRAVVEEEEIVVGTSAMPVAQWKACYVFGYLLSTLYNQRLAFLLLRAMRQVYGLDIQRFLEFVISAADSSTPQLFRMIRSLESQCNGVLQGKTTVIAVEEHGEYYWEPHEACYLLASLDPDRMLADLSRLARKYAAETGCSLPADQLEDLMRFQAAVIPRFGRAEPFVSSFNWDWLTLLRDGSGGPVAISKRKLDCRFTPPPILESSSAQFARSQIRVTRSGTRTLCRVDEAGGPGS